ncbi:MAG: hypothetical protein AAGE52_07665 [Myxococcota bacterium]
MQELQRLVPAIDDEQLVDDLEREWTPFHVAPTSALAEAIGEVRKTVDIVDHELQTTWVIGEQSCVDATEEWTVERSDLRSVSMQWAREVLRRLIPGEWEIDTRDGGSVYRFVTAVHSVEDPGRQATVEELAEAGVLTELDISEAEAIGEEFGLAQPPLFKHLVCCILLVGLRKARPLPPAGSPVEPKDIWARIHQGLVDHLPAATDAELDALDGWLSGPAERALVTFDLVEGQVWRAAVRHGSALRVHSVPRYVLGTCEFGEENERKELGVALDFATRVVEHIFACERHVAVNEFRLVVSAPHGSTEHWSVWWLGYALLAVLRRDRPLHYVDATSFLGEALDALIAEDGLSGLEALDETLSGEKTAERFGALPVLLPTNEGYRSALALEVVETSPVFPCQVIAADVGKPAGTLIAVARRTLSLEAVSERAMRVLAGDKGLGVLPWTATILSNASIEPSVTRALVECLRARRPVTHVHTAQGYARWYDDLRWRPRFRAHPKRTGFVSR